MLIIREMESTVEEAGAPASSTAVVGVTSNEPLSKELEPEDFRRKYGLVLRAMVREELERYLRTAAD